MVLDRPKAPATNEESKSKPSREETRVVISEDSSLQPTGGDGDDDDANKRKPDETPPSKGDESQDPKKKEEEKEASAQDQPQSSGEKAAQDKIENLLRLLQEAREAQAEAEKAAREAQEASQKAAEDKAQKTGEELAQEIDDEKAKKERKREASKEKKREKKKKKSSAASVEAAPAPDDEGESEPSEGDEDKPEGEKSKDKKPEKDERPKDKPEGEGEEGPPKDEEPTEPWTEVIRRAAKPRQNISKAAEKARARTYPRPMCEATAQVNYTYAPQHIPTREPFTTGKWSVIEKIKDIPLTRNPMRLKDNPHKAIFEHGTRRRYTDYKVCILQVLEAAKQTPPPASPFALDGGEAYWVQTTIQVNDDSHLPFSELPGMFPSLYTFDTFWEIPIRGSKDNS